MTALLVLILFTTLIIFLQRKIWRERRNILFPVFTLILYYWSMAGGWLFIFDHFSGVGEKIGMDYYYLLDKMFFVTVDNTYALALAFYGTFIVVFQLMIWLWLRYGIKEKEEAPVTRTSPIELTGTYFGIAAVVAMIASFLVAKKLIIYTLILDESVYINIRSTEIPHYVIHQYFNWLIPLSLFVYLGLAYRKEQRYVQVRRPNFFFWIAFVVCNAYLVAIGSRHEVFFAGILAGLIFLFPHTSWRNAKKTVLSFGLIWLVILALNDPVRSLMPVIARKTGITSLVSSAGNMRGANYFRMDRSFVVHHSPQLATHHYREAENADSTMFIGPDTVVVKKKLLLTRESGDTLFVEKNGKKIIIPNPYVSTAYQKGSAMHKLFRTAASMLFSNEIFAGHFSLYGIFRRGVKPSPGVALKNLAGSFIPSTISSERAPDTYAYYAKAMHFSSEQGFTINFISAWYLNAGWFGLVLGPAYLCLLLMIPYSLSRKSTRWNRKVLGVVISCSITSFCVVIIRTGPEVLKATLYEAVLLPMLLLIGAFVFQSLLNGAKKRRS